MEEVFNLRYEASDKSVCFESPERIFYFMINVEKSNSAIKYKYLHPATDKEAKELFSLYISGELISGSTKALHKIYLSAHNRFYIRNATGPQLLIPA